MAAGDEYERVEAAYQRAVVGGSPPTLIAISGQRLLEFRPDLKMTIDPRKSYYVTKDSITEIEED